MEALPPLVMALISVLPLAGAATIAVVLLALAFNRERWIFPAALCFMFAAGVYAGAVEYGDQAKEYLARLSMERTRQESVHEGEFSTHEEGRNEELAEPEEPREEPETATAERTERTEKRPAPHLVPLTDREAWVKEEERRTRRKVVVVSPAANTSSTRTRTEPARPTSPSASTRNLIPAPAPKTTSPTRETRPEPKPAPPSPSVSTPPVPSSPSPSPSPGPSSYQPRTTVAPVGGTGTLVVKIRGPLVETSKKPVAAPHLLILLPSASKVELVPPTRVKETRKDNDPNGELLAVTYFWENVTVTFRDVEAGWHFIMLDTSLDDPRTHQARMTNPATQGDNDYNGTVEIKAGKTTVMEFGTKNFMTGKFPEPRVR